MIMYLLYFLVGWGCRIHRLHTYLYQIELVELELSDKTELLEIEMVLTIELCTHAKLNSLK